MAGDWIKVRTTLPNDGRLKIVSRKCHASSVTALGALVTLWSFADAHANSEGVLLGYGADDVDALVCLPGFCAALPVDWIDVTGEWVKLPEYQEHNGSTAKTRAQATKRKRTERTVTNVTTMSRSERDTSVTREEKRREEKKEQKNKPAIADVLQNVSLQIADDFRKLRKDKKAPITQTAVDGIKREAAKAGMSLDEALAMCCERGWSGFKADWVSSAAKPAEREVVSPSSLPFPK